MLPSKTKTSFYRRLYIAYLIDSGCNTIPKIQSKIDIPRRTAQDTINALNELDIECRFKGAQKNGHYYISSWGPFNIQWIQDNANMLAQTLGYLSAPM
ncbi:helix-turn-helix domain-containing protein [Vibrio sp. McD22-P3]|uniref:helix-turn-helix domain-containing protein n=1 Tax=Vibrio sp. McD22-P3 TaxID=2724880 RepID=UPI001F25E3C6|nr:helix-turn-helix domain-containing protein [Vibrio sp. McD22-P3]MCF4176359.1 winged helix-turn-helix domain-containing protein [Vibrio sp. McD22-P3]